MEQEFKLKPLRIEPQITTDAKISFQSLQDKLKSDEQYRKMRVLFEKPLDNARSLYNQVVSSAKNRGTQ
jgi:hypothetical protein